MLLLNIGHILKHRSKTKICCFYNARHPTHLEIALNVLIHPRKCHLKWHAYHVSNSLQLPEKYDADDTRPTQEHHTDKIEAAVHLHISLNLPTVILEICTCSLFDEIFNLRNAQARHIWIGSQTFLEVGGDEHDS